MTHILNHHFIGRVQWTSPEHSIGGIEPLWMETDKDAVLLPADPDWFPETGQVFWGFPPEEVEIDSLWRFSIKENQKGPTIKQVYAVHSAAPARITTVADLRSLGRETVRKDLTQPERGLKIPFDLIGQVYLWLEDELWVGPIVPYREEGRWFLMPDDCKAPLRCVFPSKPAAVMPDEMLKPKDQISHFLIKRITNLRSVGQLDWSSDEIVLKRALRAGATLTQAHIDQLVLGLDATLLSDSSQLLERDRHTRVTTLIQRIKGNHNVANNYADLLLKIPSVQKIVADQKKQMLTEYQAQIEEQLENLRSEISELTTEKRELDRWIHQYTAERNRLEKEVQEKAATQAQAIAEKVEEAQDALRTRWEAFRNNVIPDMAQLEVLRVLMSPDTSYSPDASPSLSPARKATWPWREGSVGIHSNMAAFQGTLKKSITGKTYHSSGIAGRVARSLMAVFFADAFPVLAGDGARGVLEAFGTVAVGGRVLKLNITPNHLEPTHLYGYWERNGWRREQNGLLDLLDTARQSLADKDERLYLVVLEGINRAPVETYLLPLLAAFRNRFSSQPSEAFPLHNAEMISWTPNVLLAGTLCDGVARVAPGTSFWSDAVLLHLGNFFDDENDALPDVPTSLPLSQITTTQLNQWRDQACHVSTEKCDEILLEGLGQDIGLRRDLIPQSRRIWCQLNHLSTTKSEKILAQWMSLVFPAPIVSAGRQRQGREWIENSPYNIEDWSRYFDCAQKCLS